MIKYSSIQNKNVLITGGTRGIGQSIKKAFLDNKANVFFTGTKIEDKNKSESESDSDPESDEE